MPLLGVAVEFAGELLDRRNVDAVLIAKVGGHAPASILAAQAGKAVHCEKPSAPATA
jgi:predicted dehydrogenase